MDISLTLTIPNINVFSQSDFIFKSDKKIKSDFRIETNEKFYKNGIIENLFIENDATDLHICNHNWLLAVYICNTYISDIENIKLLTVGYDDGFMTGVRHFVNLNSTDIESISVKTDDKFNYKDFTKTKYSTRRKFNNSNMLFCDINTLPLYAADLAMSVFSGAIFIARIMEPEYWDNTYFNSLLLYSLIFNKTEIIRFPICQDGNAYFAYYVIGTDKKMLLHAEKISRRINVLIKKSNTNLIINMDSSHDTEINEWKTQLLNVKKHYTKKIINPVSTLYSIINKLKHDL